MDGERAARAAVPRAGRAFFERFGRLTPVQVATIGPLARGEDALVAAPTASGKTEAVAAPLAERDLTYPRAAPALLYVCPTRALVNDLHRRLVSPLERLGIRLGRKTSDHRVGPGDRLERWLITTPESLDSLLVRRPRDLTGLRALVIDEVHLLDGTPRGDQLRALVARLARLHRAAVSRGDRDPNARLQTVLVSATVEDPAALVAAFAPGARTIACGGARAIHTVGFTLGGEDELVRALARIPRSEAAKLLVFTRSRAECEEVAGHLAGRPPYGPHVFAHHASLSRRARLTAEAAFHRASAAVFVATSTLELGIDIGDVDWIVQYGPPASVSSFLQQVGRGCRRRADITRVMGVARGAAEQVIFEVLLDRARQGRLEQRPRLFWASVVAQQVASYLAQRSSGSVGRPELEELFASAGGPPAVALLDAVLPEMVQSGLLEPARAGRYAAGPELERWLESDPRRLHTTIGSARDTVAVFDAATHEHLGDVPRKGLPAAGPVVFGGRTGRLSSPAGGDRAYLERGDGEAAAPPRWWTPRMPMSLELARAVRDHIGVVGGLVPALPLERERFAIFPFLGGLGNRVLAAHLRSCGLRVRAVGDLGIELDGVPALLQLKPDAASLARAAATCWKELERAMDPGLHVTLVPEPVRRQQVVARLEGQGLPAAVAEFRDVMPVEGGLAGALAPLVRA